MRALGPNGGWDAGRVTMAFRLWAARLLVIALALGFALPGGSEAQAVDDPTFTEIAVLAESDPEAALTEIEAALDRLAAAGEPALRSVFDLNRLAAELLEGLDRRAEAAEVLENLGQFAQWLQIGCNIRAQQRPGQFDRVLAVFP